MSGYTRRLRLLTYVNVYLQYLLYKPHDSKSGQLSAWVKYIKYKTYAVQKKSNFLQSIQIKYGKKIQM